MAINKSELYSTLWESCDQLRGGMDASQYKDYVLAILFIKYVSDIYAGLKFAPIIIPEGATFQDMVHFKGKPEIGDFLNKKIFAPIRDANKMSDFPDFNDDRKLGSGKEKVDRLTELIAIFEKPDLDFSKSSAEDGDILGDAYEFLVRSFAMESGKSKGQFYTPVEVSRVIAKIIGINKDNSTSSTTVYDPVCGSGSLLIKISEQAEKVVTLYGQDIDENTVSLAIMNLVLHNQVQNLHGIRRGNTFTDPKFVKKEGRKEELETFDYVVANPPFSLVNWASGLIDYKSKAVIDKYNRFTGFGIPPEKNGDYAFLLHIIKSLKLTGKGAIVLPHSVLFRGGIEGEIRRNIIRKRYIKGIVGLPANLFYGTGIPACIILIDKEGAEKRKGIFMIDASREYIKDANKNLLREQDVDKIVDIYNKQLEIKKYSRFVSLEEIGNQKNNFNLDIPRYFDNTAEDINVFINTILYGPPGTGKTYQLNEYKDLYFTDKGIKQDADVALREQISVFPLWQVVAAVLQNYKESVSVSTLLSNPLIKAKINPFAKAPRQMVWRVLQSYADDSSTELETKYRVSIQLFQKDKDSRWRIIDGRRDEIPDIIEPELLDISTKPILPIQTTPSKKRFNFITFHQKFSYEDFIEGIKPLLKDGEVEESTGELQFELKKGIFYNSCLEALHLVGYKSYEECYNDSIENRIDKFQEVKGHSSMQYALFIDEINRANISAVFGELITLLEEDKRIGAANEMWVELPYSNERFCVPPNLYVIGTMNTADRSIALLDIALRRRFEFKSLYPIYTETEWWATTLERLNQAMYNWKKNPDFFIGHAFFMHRPAEDLTKILNSKIIPLLFEYCQNNNETIKRILDDAGIPYKQGGIKENFQILAV